MTLTYFLYVKNLNQEHFGRLNVVISQMVTDRAILLLPTHRKLLIGFPLVYLHLTLAHFKGQSQGHVNFDGEYLINGDR